MEPSTPQTTATPTLCSSESSVASPMKNKPKRTSSSFPFSTKWSRRCTQHITFVLAPLFLCLWFHYTIYRMVVNQFEEAAPELKDFNEAVFKSTVNVTGITAISEETPMVEERSVETLMTGAMKEEDVTAPTLPNFQCLKHFQSELNKIQNLAKNSTIPILGSIVPARNGVIEVIFIMTHLPKQDYKRWYQKSWYCSVTTPAVMRGIDPRSHTLTIQCPSLSKSIVVGDNVAQYYIPSNICPWKFQPAHISACTMIKGPEAKTQLPAWIAYHRAVIGIEQFYVYINEEMDEPPFHHENVHWIPFQDTLNKKFLLQRAMQNDCIARARFQSDWVALHDVDEFFQLMDGGRSTNVSHILQPYDGKKIGGISIRNVFFGHNPDEVGKEFLDKNMTLPFENFRWRAPSPCGNGQREKMIVQPNHVKYFSVHKITLGGPMQNMNAQSKIRMNHYKLASEGVYNPPKGMSCHVGGGFERNALVHDDSMHAYVEQVRTEVGIMMRASASHSLYKSGN